MPIFEFVCRGCGRQFEDLMSLAQLEAGEAACPDCGSREVERSFSAFAIGSGRATSGPACGRDSCGSSGFG